MIFLLSSLLAIGASVFAFAVCTFWAINIARDEPNQRPPLWWVMIALAVMMLGLIFQHIESVTESLATTGYVVPKWISVIWNEPLATVRKYLLTMSAVLVATVVVVIGRNADTVQTTRAVKWTVSLATVAFLAAVIVAAMQTPLPTTDPRAPSCPPATSLSCPPLP